MLNIVKKLTGRYTKGQRNSKLLIVVHDTASGNATLNAILRFFTLSNAVSIHYVVGKAGEIVQMVSEDNIAWHVGVSEFGQMKDLNRCSIGIEVLSDGKNYTNEQRVAVWELCRDIMKRNKIQPYKVLRHADVARPIGRKKDIEFEFYKPWGNWGYFQTSLLWKSPFSNLPN